MSSIQRWCYAGKQLGRKDLDQLDGSALKQAAFIPSAADYAALVKEHEKLKKLYAEQALKREILRDLLKKTNPPPNAIVRFST
ncbi:hypothetical protein [Paenibacillus phytorum]|uniref:hypothetical protein n=1 Tax=Paenibacillus phytorum TaxID=2654977 RepID=UPI001493220C|nr:hypothetical protein [Paenibacillus phytorum]